MPDPDYTDLPILTLDEALEQLRPPRAPCARPRPTGIGCQRGRHYTGVRGGTGYDPSAGYAFLWADWPRGAP